MVDWPDDYGSSQISADHGEQGELVVGLDCCGLQDQLAQPTLWSQVDEEVGEWLTATAWLNNPLEVVFELLAENRPGNESEVLLPEPKIGTAVLRLTDLPHGHPME